MSAEQIFKEDQYLDLLDLAYKVIESLKGKVAADYRWPDCQKLAMQLCLHATTIYWLMQGTKSPVPRLGKGAFFYDFASIAVLARAVLETYLTLFEVFFEPKTEDDFEFNHALWLLSGFVLPEDIVPTNSALKDAFTYAQKKISEIRSRIRKTNKFNSLKPAEQRDVLKGKRKRDWSVVRAAGFRVETIRHIYSYLSGYVHADALSSNQIFSAQNTSDQKRLMSAQMSVTMIALSKMIIAYSGKFPEAKSVCGNNITSFRLATVLSEAASRMNIKRSAPSRSDQGKE